MKSLEDLSMATAAFIPFQMNKDVGRFLRYCINAGKVDPNKKVQFKETFNQSLKQIDRKWTWTKWRICTESEIENALVEKAWELLTSKDCLLAHLISIIKTWNEFNDRRKNKNSCILVNSVLKYINLINTTVICESCRQILQMKETKLQKGNSCTPLEQVMFACILINNMAKSSKEDKVLLITQFIIPAKLSSSDKFAMAAICKSLFVLGFLWEQDVDKELRRLCDDLALHLMLNFCSGDMDVIHWLCDRVEDVNRKHECGTTLMHAAVKVGSFPLFEQLLGKRADVNSLNDDKKTPLHKAAEVGNVDLICFLLDNGADISIQCSNGSTALHKAAENGMPKAIEVLLDRGAKIEGVNDDKDTPLLTASKMGKTNAIDVLLNRGAKMEVENKVENTPLMAALEFHHVKAFEMLLDRGAKIKEGCNIAQLSIKACKCNPDLILPLIDRKICDATTESDKGETFLHDVAKKGNVLLIQKLIDKGVPAGKPTKFGDTPLHFACRFDHLEAAKFFINPCGAASKNLQERTALHEAAWNGHHEIVKFLLPLMSEQCINTQDCNGKTALHFAAEFNNDKRIVCELLGKGADVQIKCKKGHTALELALENKPPEVLDAFLTRI